MAPIEVCLDRPIGGFACDDYRGTGDYGFDESRTVLLLDELDEESVREAIAEGCSVFQHRTGEGEPPRVERIDVDRNERMITVEATNYERIEWICDERVIDTGEVFLYTDRNISYVRAGLESTHSAAGTQPIKFE